MPKSTPEEIASAKRHLTPNEQLETPPGCSRMVIPGKPSLPLCDNNHEALRLIAKSLGGDVKFVSDVP
jgi:hypothetical protein